MNNILDLFNNLNPNEPRKWWQQFSYTEIYDFEISKLVNITKNVLFFQALQTNQTVIEEIIYFKFSTLKELKTDLQNNGVRFIYETINGSEMNCAIFGIFDTGALYLDFVSGSKNKAICVTINKEELEKIKKCLNV